MWEGRTTFSNTLKYVFMAISANFGSVSSVAGASLFLTSPPLLPKQVLLMNLLTDLLEMTIATEQVDPGKGRSAAPLGHRLHREVDDRLGHDEFGVRRPDIRSAPPGSSRQGSRTSYRPVRGVDGLVRGHSTRGADPEAVLPEPPCSSRHRWWSRSRLCCPTRLWHRSSASCRCLPSSSQRSARLFFSTSPLRRSRNPSSSASRIGAERLNSPTSCQVRPAGPTELILAGCNGRWPCKLTADLAG